jgi:hypothetical protein
MNCLLFLFEDFVDESEEFEPLLALASFLLDPESSGDEEWEVDEEILVIVDSLDGEFEAEGCRWQCNDARASIVDDVEWTTGGDESSTMAGLSDCTSSLMVVVMVVEGVGVVLLILLLVGNMMLLLLFVVFVGFVVLGTVVWIVWIGEVLVGEVFENSE